MHPAADDRNGSPAAVDAAWEWDRPAEAEEPLPDLPGFEVVDVRDAGGDRSVFAAKSHATGERCVLKVLHSRRSNHPVAARRFEARAAALRRLNHAHIVRVLDVMETPNGRPCFVMEMTDGCDLGRLLSAEQPDLERAVDIFLKTGSAVEYAHAHGVVHGAIRPSGIIAGRDGAVKLGDFDASKAMSEVLDCGIASAEHAVEDCYRAPDQIPGKQSDVYSLGVLLYHLLAGELPAGHKPLLSKLTGLPKAIDSIAALALEPDPERRTGTVRELTGAVASVWRVHLCRGVRARRWKRIALLLVVAGIAAGAAAGGIWWQRRKAEPPPVGVPSVAPVQPSPAVHALPASANAANPWQNSLGMKFVPVAGTKVLFSIWETRRRDFEPFLSSDHTAVNQWRRERTALLKPDDEIILTFDGTGAPAQRGTWKSPGYPATPDHPAAGTAALDAMMFCDWLTLRELNEGRLLRGQFYRLPTSDEWLKASGGGSTALREGNLAGPEARDSGWPAARPTLMKRDPFPRTSPAGSFPAEPFGLFDMSGNVSEWVLEGDEPAGSGTGERLAQIRGPNWSNGSETTAAFSRFRLSQRHLRMGTNGFRIVLVLAGND